MPKDTTRITVEEVESTYIASEETGEVKTTQKSKRQHIRYSKEPTYVKLYLDHLSRFKGVQLSLNPILAEMLKHASYASKYDSNGGMLLFLNKPLKEIIAKDCGLSLGRVDNAVTEFVKKGYMRRIKIGMYQFNPFLFGKGEWADIENIRATFDYGTGEIIAEIVKEEEDKINQATEAIENDMEELIQAAKEFAKSKNVNTDVDETQTTFFDVTNACVDTQAVTATEA